MATRTGPQARYVTVWYRRAPYLLDIFECRRALVACQVSGEFETMKELADAASVCRSTVSRFFKSGHTSLPVTMRILAVLHLRFEDVARPKTDEWSVA